MKFNNIKNFNRKINLLPGPVWIPAETKKILKLQIISQRSKDFERIYFLVQDNIKKIIDNIDGEIILLTGSGTLAMEAAIANLINGNSYPLVIINGKFGMRFSEILSSFNIKYDIIDFKFLKNYNYNLIENKLKTNKYTHLFFQATETSTGNKIDFNILKHFKEKYNVDLICDAISHILSEPFSQNLYNIDCVILGSQKGFSIPPGLSIVSLSKNYVEKRIKSKNKHYNLYYYDFSKYLYSPPPFTPAINLIYALYYNTDLILKIGIKKVIEKNIYTSKLIKSTLKNINIEIFPDNPSNSVTVFLLQNANSFVELLDKKYNILVGKGQDALNNKVIRIGHMGLTPLIFYKKLKKILIKELYKLKV